MTDPVKEAFGRGLYAQRGFPRPKPPTDTSGFATSASVAALDANKVTRGDEVLNVTDNGIVADGVTNDATAFAALITAAPAGATIIVPRGKTVRVNSTITVSKRLIFTGGGAISCPTTNTNLFSLGPAANGSIFRELTLSGPSVSSYGANSRAIHMLGTSAAARASGVTVRDCTIDGWSYGVSARLADSLVIRDNVITNSRYAGIHFFSVDRSKVVDNTIGTVTVTAPQVDAYGISINRIENQTIITEPPSSDNIVKGNHVSDVNWEGIDCHGAVNLVIDSNYVYHCLTGIALVGGANELNVETYAPQGMVVTNNIVEAGVTDGSYQAGIKIVGVGTSAGNLTDGATGVISNNYVLDHGDIGGTNRGGIVIYYTTGVAITNNTVVNGSQCGIVLYHTNRGAVIVGNVIIDPWDSAGGSTATYGIFLRDIDNNAHIEGNYIGLGPKVAGTKLDRGISCNPVSTGTIGLNTVTGFISSHTTVSVGTMQAQFKGDVQVGGVSKRVGFYGIAPIAKGAALTPATGGVINSVWDAPEVTEMTNMRTRINQIELRLQAYGLLP